MPSDEEIPRIPLLCTWCHQKMFGWKVQFWFEVFSVTRGQCYSVHIFHCSSSWMLSFIYVCTELSLIRCNKKHYYFKVFGVQCISCIFQFYFSYIMCVLIVLFPLRSDLNRVIRIFQWEFVKALNQNKTTKGERSTRYQDFKIHMWCVDMETKMQKREGKDCWFYFRCISWFKFLNPHPFFHPLSSTCS